MVKIIRSKLTKAEMEARKLVKTPSPKQTFLQHTPGQTSGRRALNKFGREKTVYTNEYYQKIQQDLKTRQAPADTPKSAVKR